MLTIADKGGCGSEKFSTKGFYGYKRCVYFTLYREESSQRTIDLDLTIYDKQSHITCKLDPNK